MMTTLFLGPRSSRRHFKMTPQFWGQRRSRHHFNDDALVHGSNLTAGDLMGDATNLGRTMTASALMVSIGLPGTCDRLALMTPRLYKCFLSRFHFSLFTTLLFLLICSHSCSHSFLPSSLLKFFTQISKNVFRLQL
jgi:hypothetical protein